MDAQTDARLALHIAKNMSSSIAYNVRLLIQSAAIDKMSRELLFSSNSTAAQKIIHTNRQRAALGRAYCELTLLQGCSEIKRPSGRPITRPFSQCSHSVSITGGFCSLNSMNGCINPLMATRLFNMFGNDSVVDLGAGQGQYGILSDSIGSKRKSGWFSVDSTENIYKLTQGSVHFADLTASADIQGVEPADWVVCIEVAEHIARSSQAAFIANLHFLNRKGIVLSWALPNQPGSHHVNCRTNAYVGNLFANLGYVRDYQSEATLRGAIASSLDRGALESSKSGQSPPYEFWGKLNNTALKVQIGRVIKHVPRHKVHLVSLSTCPWLYDTLMVFRRTHPVVVHPVVTEPQLLHRLRLEQHRIRNLLFKTMHFRNQLFHHTVTSRLQGLNNTERELLKEHVHREAAKVYVPV